MQQVYRDIRFMADGGTERPPVETPLRFADWPRPRQVEYLELSVRRMDLLALIRGYIGSDRGSDRLNKHELAAIALDLEVIT